MLMWYLTLQQISQGISVKMFRFRCVDNMFPGPRILIKVYLQLYIPCIICVFGRTPFKCLAWLIQYLNDCSIHISQVSSGGLAVKHQALGANDRRFEPRKRSKLFQGLISRLTTSWVGDHVKWRCRLH